jgi:hypothetical protein
MREVNPTKLAPLMLISITVLAVLSGMCFAMTFSTSRIEGPQVFNRDLGIVKLHDVSGLLAPCSADPISDGKPN